MRSTIFLKITTSNHFAIIVENDSYYMYLKQSDNFESAYNSLKTEDLRILKKLHDSLDKAKKDKQYSALEMAISEVLNAISKILGDEGLYIK